MVDAHRVFHRVLVDVEGKASFVDTHCGGCVLINHDGGFAVGVRDFLLWDEGLLERIRELLVGKPLDAGRGHGWCHWIQTVDVS